jgi:DNA-directed RNA polymerase III subunit RPC7
VLKRKDLHQPFFPADVFEDYFNPKRKRKGKSDAKTSSSKKMNIDEMMDEDEVCLIR